MLHIFYDRLDCLSPCKSNRVSFQPSAVLYTAVARTGIREDFDVFLPSPCWGTGPGLGGRREICGVRSGRAIFGKKKRAKKICSRVGAQRRRPLGGWDRPGPCVSLFHAFSIHPSPCPYCLLALAIPWSSASSNWQCLLVLSRPLGRGGAFSFRNDPSWIMRRQIRDDSTPAAARQAGRLLCVACSSRPRRTGLHIEQDEDDSEVGKEKHR